jgi:hypothetical protein
MISHEVPSDLAVVHTFGIGSRCTSECDGSIESDGKLGDDSLLMNFIVSLVWPSMSCEKATVPLS